MHSRARARACVLIYTRVYFREHCLDSFSFASNVPSLSQQVIDQVIDLRFHAFTCCATDPNTRYVYRFLYRLFFSFFFFLFYLFFFFNFIYVISFLYKTISLAIGFLGDHYDRLHLPRHLRHRIMYLDRIIGVQIRAYSEKVARV